MSKLTLAHLARSINLRDLGGISTTDGREVRRGGLFRSAALGELSSAERAALVGLGLRSIIDLRYNSERVRAPTPWQELGCGHYWAHDHQPFQYGELNAHFSDERLTRERAHRFMVRVYQELPFSHIEPLRRLFHTLANGEWPILFHCTSGKDRTGMAAALILSAVGTPREAVITDYLASLNFDVLASPAFRHSPPERREVLQPIYSVHRDYLDAMFAAIEARDGSIEGFLNRSLALEAPEIARLRERLLGPMRVRQPDAS